MNKYNDLVKWRKKLLSPVEGLSWASEMVLNPAIIEDPETGRIHMLVRTTGPWAQAQLPGKPLPFPIFLGYGWSDDGINFEFDLERPALRPGLFYEKDDIYITNAYGEKAIRYSNGCIEDPRLFYIGDICYMNTACRMFPAGPYWEHDEPTQCTPEWALGEENSFGTKNNPTVNVLYEVNLDALGRREYDNAFKYVTHLTNPEAGEDRDVFFFSKKMLIDGEECYIMIQRPEHPENLGLEHKGPSIVLSAAKELRDFATGNVVKRTILLAPEMEWQKEKVGASTPPVDIGGGQWLLNYHGKKDAVEGYGQSFMILEEKDNDFPVIKHICRDKMIVNEEPWEAPSKFKTPCVFFTGLIKYKDKLLCSYGAADEHVGLMEINYEELLNILRRCGDK